MSQRDVPEFLDSSWEALLSHWSGWGYGGGKVGTAGMEGVGTGIVMENEKNIF